MANPRTGSMESNLFCASAFLLLPDNIEKINRKSTWFLIMIKCKKYFAWYKAVTKKTKVESDFICGVLVHPGKIKVNGVSSSFIIGPGNKGLYSIGISNRIVDISREIMHRIAELYTSFI